MVNKDEYICVCLVKTVVARRQYRFVDITWTTVITLHPETEAGSQVEQAPTKDDNNGRPCISRPVRARVRSAEAYSTIQQRKHNATPSLPGDARPTTWDL